jgi:DNA (cytosine-5)-methyltransferase 1
MMKITHIDCFSGPGGICAGFRAAGIDTLVAIEHVKSCVDTYSANHPQVHVIHSDIREVASDQILPFIPSRGVDLVSSGMPCETFSTAGNTSRSFYDDRQFLFREGIRIAKLSKAKLILFENVPAISTKKVSKNSSKLIIDLIIEELAQEGYENCIKVVLNSTQYGIPQRRSRFFILACRFAGWKLSYPLPTSPGEIGVSEAFSGLPNVTPNTGKEAAEYTSKSSQYADLSRDDKFWRRGTKKCDTVSYQMPMRHRDSTLERFSLLRPGESLKNLFERYIDEERVTLQSRRVLPNKMFIKRNYRLKLNEPSPTVTSHCLDEFVHPVHNRALTVRECARLQSFPDSYDFCGGPYIVPHIYREVQDKYEQIGDAVPPLLAYAWGKKIHQILMENNNATDN